MTHRAVASRPFGPAGSPAGDLPAAQLSRAKRAIDVAVAGLGLAVASPVLGLVALAIRLEDGAPVLFRQDRLGYQGSTISVTKLRTMRQNDADPLNMGRVEGSHPLVTRVGRLLRRLKIDEAPQLLSVLRGDLSLVGPRPTLPEFLDDYDAFQVRRLDVRPGLTGWAQVNGGTALDSDDRIRLDVWYVDHWSILLDLRIMLRTVATVLLGERPRVDALDEATAHEALARRGG